MAFPPLEEQSADLHQGRPQEQDHEGDQYQDQHGDARGGYATTQREIGSESRTLLSTGRPAAREGDRPVIRGAYANPSSFWEQGHTFAENGINALFVHSGTITHDLIARAQAQGELRAEVDCGDAALFIFSAWEGCIGTAKSLQSPETLLKCSRQLQVYIRSLRPA